jgi:tRNA (cytidine/uridine-2'-O-)-methyltransferase
VEPEIPPNTGNIARLCAATSCHLHLVHPLGFRVDEKSVRRAGLDYWHLVELSQHDNWRSFLDSLPSEARLTFFTGKASKSFLEVRYAPGDYLVFGKESSGLADDILAAHEDQLVAIPTIGAVRSLNLANCVALGVYEAMRQLGAFDRTDLQPLQEEPAPTG